MILLRANAELRTVFQKMINTMGENVKWTDLFVINNNNIILAGEGRSLFFNFDTGRAFSNVADLSINMDRVRIITKDQLLENTLNMILYAFGKWGGIKGLKVEMNYEQLNKLINNILREINVEASLTTDNFRFFQYGIQMTYEEVIQSILELSNPKEQQELKDSDVENEEDELNNEESQDEDDNTKQTEGTDEYALGLWHNIRWSSAKYTFVKEEMNQKDKVKKRLGNNFYMVNYKCPVCGEKLCMVVYPVEKEFRIETDEEAVYMARAYTCNACYHFFTPKPHKLLVEGDVYSLSFEDDQVAYEDYLELIGRKGERTSNSNFNEYESEYIWKNPEPEPQLEELCNEIESLSDEEIEELEEKMESGFFPQISMDRFLDQVHQERKDRIKRNVNNPYTGENGSANNLSQFNENEDTDRLVDQEQRNNHPRSSIFPVSLKNKNVNISEKKHVPISNGTISIPKEMNSVSNLISNHIKSQDNQDQVSEKSETTGYQIPNQQQSNINNLHTETNEHVTEDLKEIEEDAALKNLEELEDILDSLLRGEFNSFKTKLEHLSSKQLDGLKLLIRTEQSIEERDKTNYLDTIDRFLFKAKEQIINQKVLSVKDKTYSDIIRMMDQIQQEDCPEMVKESMMETLKGYLEMNGEKELKQMALHLSDNISKKQYAQYNEKLDEYQEIDTSRYKKMLDEKRDVAEKQEISNFILKANATDRKAMYDLYNQLKNMDFEERNVGSYLESIYDKIYAMDEAAIRKICPEPADIDFDEGLQMYEEINVSSFLPELKVNVLGVIDQRLKKIKMDECEQLVRKFSKDMNWTEQSYPRVYFYDVRKMLRGSTEDTGSICINNALHSYASEIGPYEYPIIVCDGSISANGKGGFVLTSDHIFYSTLVNSGVMKVTDVEQVFAGSGLLSKGIYVNHKTSGKVKISNSLKSIDLKKFAVELNGFIEYLQEKPESRNISYLAKEKHAVICCYRCGYVYKGGTACPKCGAKINE